MTHVHFLGPFCTAHKKYYSKTQSCKFYFKSSVMTENWIQKNQNHFHCWSHSHCHAIMISSDTSSSSCFALPPVPFNTPTQPVSWSSLSQLAHWSPSQSRGSKWHQQPSDHAFWPAGSAGTQWMLFAVNISAGEDCLQNSAACRFAGLADDFEQCLSTHWAVVMEIYHYWQHVLATNWYWHVIALNLIRETWIL